MCTPAIFSICISILELISGIILTITFTVLAQNMISCIAAIVTLVCAYMIIPSIIYNVSEYYAILIATQHIVTIAMMCTVGIFGPDIYKEQPIQAFMIVYFTVLLARIIQMCIVAQEITPATSTEISAMV